MTVPRTEDRTTGVDSRKGRLPVQLLVECVIGIAFALILITVAWASSHAIQFVYGGY